MEWIERLNSAVEYMEDVSLQELERRVITEWLPTSGYEYAEIPDIEVYIKADPKDAIYEYWLPVVKKEDNSGCINNQSGISV